MAWRSVQGKGELPCLGLRGEQGDGRDGRKWCHSEAHPARQVGNVVKIRSLNQGFVVVLLGRAEWGWAMHQPKTWEMCPQEKNDRGQRSGRRREAVKDGHWYVRQPRLHHIQSGESHGAPPNK